MVSQIKNSDVERSTKRFLCLECDDNFTQTKLYSNLLREHFTGSTCEQHFGKGLPAPWSQNWYDAIIVNCPTCEAECISYIRRLRTKFSQVPIILVSINATEEKLVQAFRLGIDDYLSGRPETLWRLPFKVEKLIEHNELTKRLRGERDFSKRLIENANAMIVAIDFQGRALLFNKKIEKVSGYDRDEILGKNLIDLFAPKDHQAELRNRLRSYKEGRSMPLMDSQYPLLTKDGRTILTSWNANVLRDYDGKEIGLIGVGQDITAIKRLEERLKVSEKLRTIGELASGVAHHFNNLLGVLLRRTELLIGKLKDRPEAFLDLESIKRTCLDGAEVVKRIQNFARQENPEKFDPIYINDLLSEVIEITRPKWRDDCLKEGALIQVETNFDNVSPTTGNSAELKELFTNLILNSVDAMPQGGIISVSTNMEDGSIIIRFRDNGVGMDQKTVKRIFDPFFTNKGSKGNGLGLSIVYDTVRRHKGDISVNSSLGKGTEFVVRLPIRTPIQITTTPTENKEERTPKKILLLDDEKDYRFSTAELLKLIGHDVTAAATGEEAIGFINNDDSFDVMLSDISLPDMDGWEVIEKIKKKRSNIKVIVISGHGASLENQDERIPSVDLFLHKPCAVEEVDEAITKVMTP
ncbi:response regulator [Bdellovibrionota bacterium]